MSQGTLRQFGDKRATAEVCLKSFRDSLGPLRVKVWAILDRCPDEYEAMVRGVLGTADLEILRRDGIGNAATFALQRELLVRQDVSELVFLAEDDYLYRPGQLGRLVEFLTGNPDADFVTPYDHPDAYALPVSMSKVSLRVFAGYHWHTVSSTCLTFMTRRNVLRSAGPLFSTYSRRNYDASIWHALTKQGLSQWISHPVSVLGDLTASKIVGKTFLFGWRQLLFGRRYSLWSPIPSVATHLQEGGLAPNIDWFVQARPEVSVGQTKS